MSSKCPYCGAEVLLKDADFIYHTAKSRHWGKVWVCSNFPKCNSYVGCHQGTSLPLGRLANERLRTLKMEAHKQFEKHTNGYQTCLISRWKNVILDYLM